MQQKYKENEHPNKHNEEAVSKVCVNALNINIFLQAILESPEKTNAQVEANLASIFSIFDLDYIEIFLSHQHEPLGDLMLNIVRVNWNIIPSPTQYIPLLIHYTFDVILKNSSFQLRLTELSKIIEYEIVANEYWDDSLGTYSCVPC